GHARPIWRAVQGSSPLDPAVPTPVASARTGRAAAGSRLGQRAAATGPRGMPPAPPAAAETEEYASFTNRVGRRSVEGGAGGFPPPTHIFCALPERANPKSRGPTRVPERVARECGQGREPTAPHGPSPETLAGSSLAAGGCA